MWSLRSELNIFFNFNIKGKQMLNAKLIKNYF